MLFTWGIVLYSAITQTPIEEALPTYNWWIFFMLLDIWTWKMVKMDMPAIKEKLND